MFEIMHINIRKDYKEFSDIVDDTIADESSRTGIGFDWSSKDSKLKSGSSMYKITLTNQDSGNNLFVVGEHSNYDIVFKPMKISNYNHSFYKWDYQDDDLINLFGVLMKKLALKSKGSFGFKMDNDITLVNDGRDISSHVVCTGLIDDRGKIYYLGDDQNIQTDDDDDMDTSTYVPKYLVNDWLDENLPFQQKLQTIPKADQFELMGQFAIYQKRKGMLTADQFRDIMLQIGTFADMVGGFKDESVKNIYQFFV